MAGHLWKRASTSDPFNVHQTIRYDGNGADSGSTASQTIAYGSSVTVSASGFAREHYSFAGWNTAADGGGVPYAAGQEVSDLTSDLVLYAQWTAQAAAVTFDGNGSTGGSTAPMSVVYGAGPAALTPNGFTRTGYSFQGWNTEADGSGTSYADGAQVSDLGADLALYAVWAPVTCTVSFDGNGGTGSAGPLSVTYGAGPAALPSGGFSREHYSFAGWNTAADGGGVPYAAGQEVSDLTSDLVLYAQWTAQAAAVTFDGNGSTGGSTAPMSVVYGAGPAALTPNGFTRTGYSFQGWNTEADGSGTSYADGAQVSDLGADLALYAQWEEVDVTGVDVSPLAAFIAVLFVLIAGGALFAAPFLIGRH